MATAIDYFYSDVEPFKYKYRIGFETLVVYTLNSWASYVSIIITGV